LASARRFTITILVVAVISAAVVAYIAFPPKPGGESTTTAPGGTVEYAYPTANGNPTISVRVGEVFAIQLNSNSGSTGYDWVVSSSAGIQFLNYTVVSTSSLIGGPQVRNYFFHVSSIGSQTITFRDMRSFAPGDVAATIDVQVSVS
jgi:predicted secreted protein